MKRSGPALALAFALACSTPPAPAPPPASGAKPLATGVATLLGLGEQALAAGEPALARDRFERVLVAAPGSAAAQVGLGRALTALDQPEAARAALEAALAAEPDSAAAHEAVAMLALDEGDRAGADAHLRRAVAIEPARISAHQALAQETGAAPAGADGDAFAVAEAHPYDPRARLAAGRAAIATGDAKAAREHLESVLVLADLDAAAAQQAQQLLAASFPDWAARRVVPVHAYADERLRADPAWRFQLRFAWLEISQALDPLLATRFVVVEIGAFRSETGALDLAPMLDAARAQLGTPPRSGIVAFLTGRPAPRLPGVWKQGQAEFLGRELIVRLAPGELASRVLAHEVIHLFGGVHVNPDVASLMNPSGDSNALDPMNARILRALRGRRFGPGGIDANVLAAVPTRAVIDAYDAALRANLALRRAGVVEALESARGSLGAAVPGVRAAIALDDHMADVSAFLGDLLLRERRPAVAARLFAVAGQLYGPATPRGRRALERARALAPAG